MRSLREILKKITLPIEDSSRYSYESVADPKLRSYLEEVENVIGGVPENRWQLSGVAAAGRVADSLNLGGLYSLYALYDFVRLNDVIDLVIIQSGKGKNSYFFTPDAFRAFSALSWKFKESGNYIKGRDRFAGIVSATKLALGDHPLSQLLREPAPYVKDAKASEIDFSQGEFWQIPLGQAVRNFIETEVIDKGISFPLTTAQAANLLKLRLEGRSSYFMAGLGKAGLFARVERDAERHYLLGLEHIVIAGLALLYLEKGYSLGQIKERLPSLLDGTSLAPFVGDLDSEYYTYRRRNIFADDSPWLKFPLEPIQAQSASINSSKQKPDDKLEENPKDKWVPQDKRLLIIPKISSELILYHKEKMELLLNDFNNTPDDDDVRDCLPLLMIQNIMFILAAHERRLSEYDRKKEFYTISETRAGIKACFEEWEELEKSQKITNLFHLFQLVEWKVRKNADIYWSSRKTVVE